MSTPTPTPTSDLATTMSTWRLAVRVARHEPRSFLIAWALFVLFFTLPALAGYLLALGFDALSTGNETRVYVLAGLLIAVELLRMVTIHFAALSFTKSWVHMQTFLRANLLTAQLASGGPEAGQPVGSAGEALTHFRDDVEDVGQLIDGVIDVTGGLAFSAIAGFILATADWRGAAVLVIPLVAVVLATRALDSRVKAYRAADREATAAVTGLLGDVMAAATTVKVNGASETVLARLQTFVSRRGRTALRDRVLNESVMGFSTGAVDVGFGLVLLVSASAIASGSLSVGVLALFAAYLGWLSFLPRMIGRVLARRKQADVAIERMRGLVAGQDRVNLVRDRSLPLELWQQPERPDAQRPVRVPLEHLEVRELVARYPGPDRAGVGPVSFVVERGSFVVVTGPVGSGKSTLLRSILGLGWRTAESGAVLWNGDLLVDRGGFLVPPNAAFLPQVPQLISDSVFDNVALGPIEPHHVDEALALAAIGSDVARFPEGDRTMIGPRGLRLSGGQRQRLATARALVHQPELVVLDDLSSALDVETEVRLWDNLAAAGLTVIAVSHRTVAFERATEIVRLTV